MSIKLKLKAMSYSKYPRDVLDSKVKKITTKYNMSQEDLEELSLIISVLNTQEMAKVLRSGGSSEQTVQTNQ